LKSCTILVDTGREKQLHVDYAHDEISSCTVRGDHINGIEGL
jgi:hypothetical protein